MSKNVRLEGLKRIWILNRISSSTRKTAIIIINNFQHIRIINYYKNQGPSFERPADCERIEHWPPPHYDVYAIILNYGTPTLHDVIMPDRSCPLAVIIRIDRRRKISYVPEQYARLPRRPRRVRGREYTFRGGVLGFGSIKT